jgi:hypothetical protein
METENALYNALKEKTKIRSYDEKVVRACILMLKKGGLTEESEKLKLEIVFNMCSRITLKNIHNFFSLLKKMPNSMIEHTKDDVFIECYFIFKNSVDKFNLEYGKKFYLYYNKALTFGLYRIYQKKYKNKKIYKVDINEEEKVFQNSNGAALVEQKEGELGMILPDVSFTEMEIAFIKSKLKNQKVKNFCQVHNLTQAQYFAILHNLRKKLSKEYGFIEF